MHGLKIAVRAFCVIAFVTGALDMINGIGLLGTAGAHLENVARDPVLNSQVRFWGAIWFGFGVVLWRSSSNLRGEQGLFRLLCGIIGLSGLARLASALLFGLPGVVLTGAMFIELAAAVGFLLWHASVLRQRAQTSRFANHQAEAADLSSLATPADVRPPEKVRQANWCPAAIWSAAEQERLTR